MRLFLSILIIVISSSGCYSQKIYKTSSGELIISRAINNSPFFRTTSSNRLSLFFHYNYNFHYDLSRNVGVYTGISISNIGFIYKNEDTTYKKRAYTFGIPLALKFGNLNNDNYLIAGVELGIPFHYKQKQLINKQKIKYSSFFDKRVNTLLPSVFAGIQFSHGFCFKGSLYLTDFLNKDFKGTDFGETVNYKDSDSQLFLLSLSLTLKDSKIKKIIKNENRYASL